MTEQVKVRVRDASHVGFHKGEWLTVIKDNGEWIVDGVLVVQCRCPAAVSMYIQAEHVYKRRLIDPGGQPVPT